MVRLKLFTLLITMMLAVTGQAYSAGKVTDLKEAEQFVNGLGERAINSLHGREPDDPERVRIVQELLSETLDIPRIGRIVLGSQWRKASEDERGQYQELFREYILIKYALLVSGYSGETFKITNSQKAGKRDAMVFTNIFKDGKQRATVGWRITNNGKSLMVLDVKVEKISMVQTEKSQFQTILQKDGLDGLMDLLREQLAKMQKKLASN